MPKPVRSKGKSGAWRHVGSALIMDRLDGYGFEEYEENQFPLAYLLTFRTHGSWLHGDKRGSFQRKNKTVRRIEPNETLHDAMSSIVGKPVILTKVQRRIVETAVNEVCDFREYHLRGVNVRPTHMHAVVSKAIKPEKIVNDFKAYATRSLRTLGEFGPEQKIWSRGSSTRYLWKPKNVNSAVEYVLYSQGDIPPETIFVDG